MGAVVIGCVHAEWRLHRVQSHAMSQRGLDVVLGQWSCLPRGHVHVAREVGVAGENKELSDALAEAELPWDCQFRAVIVGEIKRHSLVSALTMG